MRLQLDAADVTRRIPFRLSTDARHVSALLTHEAAGWTLRFSDGDAEPVTRHLAPSRTVWPSALRLALAVCEERLGRR
jgi:hypothetical protein